MWRRVRSDPFSAATRPDLVRYTAKLVLVGAAYYVSARMGLRLSLVRENVTPLWPPTGIAVVAFLVFGRAMWPGVALAALLVNLPISTNAGAAAATAVGNTLAPLCAAYLLVKVGFRHEIDRLRDAIAIVFLGALLSMLISASIGTGTLVLSDAIPGHKFLSTWAVWWAGDAMGVLVVAPLLLTLGFIRKRLAAASWLERLEWAATLAAITTVAFAVMNTHLRLMAVVLPLVGWAAWRFQQRGAAPAALIVAGIASWAAAHGWGPFDTGSLFEKMITLQAFNATVAFSSFVFAALVTERVRAREALERAASELEDRVRLRTSELSAANEQLAEAQRLASIGSWEWDIPEDRVSWSDEMYRIHGHRPQAFPVTFERAMQQVLGDDVAPIRRNVERVLRAGRDQDVPVVEYRIALPDGTERVLLGKARLSVAPDGSPLRMVGTVQDITEGKRAEREHRIAETLQRSLLPDRLPEIPGVLLAARYVPASQDMEVGGDWYDVVQLPNGHVGLAIGDVAGHGLRAASTMGQLRMALRAYALEEESPEKVVSRAHQLVQRLLPADLVTLVYLVFDPETGTVWFSNAGHPPPLLIEADGSASYVEDGLAPPLGAVAHHSHYVAVSTELAPGSTLALYTDGLVERRGTSIHDGLERLRSEASGTERDLEALCDHILGSMMGDEVADDVALLVLRPALLSGKPLIVRVPAEPGVLAPLRQTLRRWLREVGATETVVNEVLIASGEACANVIQHAYGAREGVLELELALADGDVEVTIRDGGAWRSFSGAEGGHGLRLMRGMMDTVDVSSGATGTMVRMRRALDVGSRERARTR